MDITILNLNSECFIVVGTKVPHGVYSTVVVFVRFLALLCLSPALPDPVLVPFPTCIAFVSAYYVCVCVCVCVFIKLHITAQSGPVILVILCHSH